MLQRENFFFPLPRRQHFRENIFRCPFRYPKVPLEAGAPPNLLMLPTPLVHIHHSGRVSSTINSGEAMFSALENSKDPGANGAEHLSGCKPGTRVLIPHGY